MAEKSATAPRSKNLQSALAIVATLVVAALIAWAGAGGSVLWQGWRLFVLCGVVSFVVNWIVFVPSFLARTEHYFDITGTATYLTLLVVALALNDQRDSRGFLIAALVATWGLRLGTFLFARIKRDGRDDRFDRIKVDFGQFLMTFTLQGLWVFLTLAAGLGAMTSDSPKSIGVWAIVGLALWVAGFAIEVTADRQKSAFRSDPANKSRFITTGLWAWSRHPNYFGEILLWTGIAVIAFPVLQGWQYVLLISPVFVYTLLTRISGLPMLEAKAKAKWGDEPAYQEYRANTPALMLRPPRR